MIDNLQSSSQGSKTRSPDEPASESASPSQGSTDRVRTQSRLRRRACALTAACGFVAAGLLYSFFWARVVDHQHYWATPGDLWSTFQVAVQAAHGHVSSIYVRKATVVTQSQIVGNKHYILTSWFYNSIQTFPGILVVLLPLGALVPALHLTRDVLPHVFYYPKAWYLLGPFALAISTLPIFASDALAERFGVSTSRRWFLAVVQCVALWQVSVFYGHPEDALAVGFLLYAVLFAATDRWKPCGWLVGVALAFQPLVILALPVMMAYAGRRRLAGLLVRSAIPPVVLILYPLVTHFSATYTAFTQQPNYPLQNFATPWTSLSPTVHFPGSAIYAVASGPGRFVAIALSLGLGLWAIRWRAGPGLLLWAVALALALRCFTESVMDPYYLWPPIAVAIVASSLGSNWQFGTSLGGAVLVSITSQLHMGWLSWWTLNLALLVAFLVVSNPEWSFDLAGFFRSNAAGLRVAAVHAIREADTRSRQRTPRADPAPPVSTNQKKPKPKPSTTRSEKPSTTRSSKAPTTGSSRSATSRSPTRSTKASPRTQERVKRP
jgi:hypothetical protein